jgi:hypothetical protein
VDVVRASFQPSVVDVEWARRVFAADDKDGVSVVDGRMVDAPVVEQARRILERCGELGEDARQRSEGSPPSDATPQRQRDPGLDSAEQEGASSAWRTYL